MLANRREIQVAMEEPSGSWGFRPGGPRRADLGRGVRVARRGPGSSHVWRLAAGERKSAMIVAKHRGQASDDAHEIIELEGIVVRFCGDSGESRVAE